MPEISIILVILITICSSILSVIILGGVGYFIYKRSQQAKALREAAQAVVNRYPIGAAVTVYYNPDNPAEAALER